MNKHTENMDIIQQIRNKQAQSTFPVDAAPPEHKPEMLYIGCVDARLAIDSDIGVPNGKAMIFRNIAALVPRHSDRDKRVKKIAISLVGELPQYISVAAILEFYLNCLPYEPGKKKQIVIAGHTNCGGIHACQCGVQEGNDDLILYLNGLKEARDRVNIKATAEGWDTQKTIIELEKESVRQSFANILTYPAVTAALAENKLEIHGWLIDTASHKIAEMNRHTYEFNAMG